MDRRSFIRGGGLGLVAFSVGGTEVLLSPRTARARDIPLSVLAAEEVRTLETIGEALVPGAAEAGLAHFVDSQLAAPAADSLLMIRYLDIPPPYAPFYHGALAAIGAAAGAMHGAPLHELPAVQVQSFVAAMARDEIAGWQGPPAGLVFFVLRNDAVDVVYGTPEGFAKLGIPYQPHIAPPAHW